MVQAAAALILNGKKILMVKRGSYTKAFPGCWGCPAGRVEKGETPEEGVIREVKEEVGLEFKPTKLFAESKWEDRDLFRYLGEWSGDISLQKEELDEFQWVTYDEASKLKLSFDYKDILEKLRQENLL